MIIEQEGKIPRIDPTAYVAPNAVISGEVAIGRDSCVLFGAIVTADGGPVTIGNQCIIMENTVVRGTMRQPTTIGNHVLIGPHAYLTGCTIQDNVFLATGTSVFNGATIGERSEVRINGVVHIKTILPSDTIVPIGWVAVGDPARILPPKDHDAIWAIQEPLNFPLTVFGLERKPRGETLMPELTRRYADFLKRHTHDRITPS